MHDLYVGKCFGQNVCLISRMGTKNDSKYCITVRTKTNSLQYVANTIVIGVVVK